MLPERPILIDARPLQTDSGFRGIGTYTRRLIAELRDFGERPIQVLAAAGRPLPAGVDPAEVGCYIRDAGRLQPLADPLLVAAALRRTRPALYHATEWGQPFPSPVPLVVTVHDLIPFLFPALYRTSRRKLLLSFRLLARADAILAVSENTARDVVRLAGVAPERVTVTPLAADRSFQPADADAIAAVRQAFGIHGRYVLAVSPFDVNKRVATLAAVFHLLMDERSLTLVIVGHPHPHPERTLSALAAEAIEQQVVMTGQVSREQLRGLYSGAICLLMTSRYEGFGLPALEAMASGTPVVAFDNSALRATLGPDSLLVPDGDVAAMADAAARLIDDPAERQRRAAAGLSWAAGFSWSRTARATLEVYNRLLG